MGVNTFVGRPLSRNPIFRGRKTLLGRSTTKGPPTVGITPLEKTGEGNLNRGDNTRENWGPPQRKPQTKGGKAPLWEKI